MADRDLAHLLATERRVDDDGWLVCTAAAHGISTGALRAALDGSVPHRRLPKAVAVALLDRTRNPDLVDPSDRRADVVRAASAIREAPEVDVGVLADELEEELSSGRDRTPKMVLYRLGQRCGARASDVDVFADAVTLLLDRPGAFGEIDTATFEGSFVVAAKLLATPGASRFVDRIARMTGDTAVGFTAALIATNPRLDPGLPMELVASACQLTWDPDTTRTSPLSDADPTSMLGTNGLHELLSRAFVRCGAPLFGPGSLAQLRGLPDDIDALTPASASELIAAANQAPAPLGEFLELWTHRGARRRPLMIVPPPAPELSLESVFAAAALPGTRESRDRFARHTVEWVRARPADASAIVAAVAEDSSLYQVLLAELPAVTGFQPPPPELDEVVTESMNTLGLAHWVTNSSTARARLIDAAAGVGEHRWTVIMSLLGEFRGTPEQLVELSAELAPTS